MSVLTFTAGLVAIAAVLWDAVETVLLPRTVTRNFRLARAYFRSTWNGWTRLAQLVKGAGRRERVLSVYGPLSLVGLLSVWAVTLILGFAVLHWSIGSRLVSAGGGSAQFGDDVYMSGTTFFTLGLGDVHPISRVARILTVIEGGLGFGFLAIVIAYFPVLYQSFSRREVQLTLLDAWAGSPPAAAEILRRLAAAGQLNQLDDFFAEWEYWCSEILEGHISYPLVAFFRSQHQKQSWVSALTAILDASALVIACVDGASPWRARMTFAIARHTAVDLSQVLNATIGMTADRLPESELEQMFQQLEAAGLRLDRSAAAAVKLRDLRSSYEPYVTGLSRTLMMPLPPWWLPQPGRDNWQTSPRRLADAHL
ncbi:MAG TPA: potassium channel family protein [Vicinamibacterales bacterium]|nr:potassium channel family protein [Vicinamibacterales bacterium]